MLSHTGHFLLLLLLIFANSLFAMSEIAVVSSRKSRLEQLSLHGDRRARAALELANDPNQILSTVQIGITLIGIFAGAFSGTTLAQPLAASIGRVPWLHDRSEAIALFLVVLMVTYLSLVFGELVPKRLGLIYPEQIARNVALPLRGLSVLVAPVVGLLGRSTEIVLRAISQTPEENDPHVTRTEIRVLIEQGTEAGTFEAAEQDMVERVLQLGDRPVSVLMTPRPEITWLDIDSPEDNNRRKVTGSSHTRFPICQNTLDNVLGIVAVTSLLADCMHGAPFDLTANLQKPLFVPESIGGLKVLELFKQTGTHVALVVDEYGVIQGLVTLNDIMEAIVGDIASEDPSEDAPVIQRADGSWLLDGTLPFDEFCELFADLDLARDRRSNFHTLGGFVIAHLGRIPAAADCFVWRGLNFEVMDMDGNRVDKVLVTP
ncbi:hemolysin [Rubidibacter lacunae KORDI 51-2]|uniref:Hemolysin n=1 Tax=Rubidibacter lacunae KORDI 51-2 TaxID=582515 RepID=U5DC99_9CHRO|nr:hemolysin family protein [Rubidibacter lacunae]ERN42158.1 hemolysin [Rubidibacter lacunae KORDI 51-2]